MRGFELVFFRHGIAAEGVPDCDRPLTEEGIRKTHASAAGLRKMDVACERIFTSPWLRATQTAAILAEVLMTGPPEQLPELAGDREAVELLKRIHKCQPGSMLLVGHQPLLSDTVAALLGAEGKCAIDFRKSGACAVEVDALPPTRPAVMKWLLTAKQLRAFGR